MSDLEDEGQCHGVQHLQWRHSMANINLCKSHCTHFWDSSVIVILTFKMCGLVNLGQGHEVQHSQWSNSMANINFYKSLEHSFFACYHHFEMITLQNVWPWICRSKSWCSTLAVAPFDRKYLISHLIPIIIFAFPSLVKSHLKKFYLENNRSRSRIQYSQWPHSMANIKLYRSRTWVFFASSPDFEISTFYNSLPWKCRSRSWSTTISDVIRWQMIYYYQWRHSWQIPDFLSNGNSSVSIFQNLLVKIATWTVCPSKFRSQTQTVVWVWLKAKICNTLQICLNICNALQFLGKSA